MGKDRLATRRDLWATRQEPMRLPINRPDHPRLAFTFDKRPYAPVAPPALSFATLRAVSPLLAPLLLGGACLTLLLALDIFAPDAPQLAIGFDALGPIIFVYAAVGVILAAALAYAPNETIWALTLLAGLISYGDLTVWTIFGPVTGIALILGLSLLLGLIVRKQAHTVLENSVHVMVLFGKHNRTLRPGFNLRLPGEQVWTILHTGDVTLDVVVRGIVMQHGARMDAQAAALCRIAPERAHQAAPHGNDWPAQVRHSLELALREALSELDPDTRGPTDQGVRDVEQIELLATRLRGQLQHLVAGWGIAVEWVRPHSLTTHPVAPTSIAGQIPTIRAQAPLPDVASGAHVAAHMPPTPTIIPATALAGTFVARPAQGGVDITRGLTPGALLPLPPAMRSGVSAPEALAEAYAAVRERRITDPTTISRIALAFEKVAGDPVLGPHLPFDAATAAQLLRRLAETSGQS